MQKKERLINLVSGADFNAYENFKDRLFIKFVARNSTHLQDCYYTTTLDVAITYHIFVSDRNHTLVSLRITDSMMEHFRIDPDRLHEDAVASMRKMYPERICFIDEFIQGKKHEQTPTVVITNQKCLCGAAAVLYPGALAKAAQMLHGSLYLIPSSTEEMFAVHDRNKDPERYRFCKEKLEGINSLNRDYDPEHFLSDTILHYDAEKKILKPAERLTA